jgi:hypothetical protein
MRSLFPPNMASPLRHAPRCREAVALAFLLACSGVLASQLSAQASVPASALPTTDQQIAAAVLPLPKDLRGGAKVLGYRTRDKLETLREGNNGMICLALFAVRDDFHVACYHKGMEPFMVRGRELRAQGVKGGQVDSVRFAEVKSGKLKMPAQAALYSLTGKKESWDPVSGKVTGASPLGVVYLPGATAASTGLSLVPVASGAWMMFPGTPKAHVMITGSMSP